MSVYKPFTTSDVIISPLKLNKNFTFEGDTLLTSSGINRYIGQNTPPPLFTSGSNLTGDDSPQDSYLIYKSIRGLYYYNFLSGSEGSPLTPLTFNTDGTVTGPQYNPYGQNYLQSSININREFPTSSNAEIGVISIPSNLYGEYIKPNTFLWQVSQSEDFTIKDDGEGNLLLDSNFYSLNSFHVGNIIYSHGIITLTSTPENFTSSSSVYGSGIYGSSQYGSTITGSGFDLNSLLLNPNLTCSFDSSITIYELQYKCTIRENEFNLTHNPTTITGSTSQGKLKEYITKPYFSPYVTSIGLHNNNGDLLAVAKLSQPLPTSPTTDTNIIINLDL